MEMEPLCNVNWLLICVDEFFMMELKT
jgi:hypothetical protein